jgi:stage II sporulation protein E
MELSQIVLWRFLSQKVLVKRRKSDKMPRLIVGKMGGESGPGVIGLARRETSAVPGLKRSRWTLFKVAVARRFGWGWHPQLYASLAFGLLLGRALPGSHTALFGIAFCAALAAVGGEKTTRSVAALAVIAGSVSVHPLQVTLWVAVGVVVCVLLSSAARLSKAAASPVGAALVAAASVAITGALQPAPGSLVLLGFWAGLAGVAALVFAMALAETLSGRHLHPAGDAPVPFIILLAAALTGLEGITVASRFALRDVAAAVVTMACAYMGGAPLGAAAGGLLGVTALFSALDGGGGANPGELLAQQVPLGYVVAGMLGGTFRELRKPGVSVAFCLALVICAAIFIPDADTLFRISSSSLAGVVLFLLLPRGWLSRVPRALVPVAPVAIATADEEPAAALPAVLDRLSGMSRVFKEVSRTFDQVAAVEAPRQAEPGLVFEQVSERVCRSCSMYRQCWEKDFETTYQVYSDLWSQLDEEGPLSTQSMPDALKQHCIFPDRVTFTLNYLHDLSRSHTHWEHRLGEGRAVVADYLKNVARMLDRFLDEVGTGEGHSRPETQPALRAESGVARLPKRGSYISGDSYAGEPLGDNRYLMALSDGMGVGRSAAAESRQCVSLLREILKAGFNSDVAVKTVNSALLLHSPEESFATVDMALVDLTTGRTEFVKVGAAPSFVKRGRDVTVVKVSSVPVGIINQVQVEPEFRNLRPGDLLVMITDGVWDVCKNDIDKERWILDYLRRESSSDPEEVAESLLARALDLMPEVGDDMTVLVARIDPIGAGPAAAAERTGNANWAPVRRAPRSEYPAGEKGRR